jgi:levanase/fructan beta-fructosidase
MVLKFERLDFFRIFGHGGVWNVQIFPMLVDGTDDYKWVMLLSINWRTNGGSATQYFVGDFDGKTFVERVFSKDVQQQKGWLDYGRDNYAGVTWSNISEVDGRKLFIGWMSNWDYAQKKCQQKHGEVV